MWIEVGHFAALTAFVLALTQTGAGVLGGILARPAWVRVGRQAALMVALLLTVASLGLIMSFLQHDFSVRYVAEHASLKLPVFYLATAMWGGHEGSLLLWVWFLAVFSAVAVWRHWSTHPLSMPWLLGLLGAVMVGFLLLVLFLSSPFERLFPAPADGRDLNPMLQDPGMVFHPPFLYLGYVGFSVPYAFAMAALLNGRSGTEWILAMRRWTLFAWAMLTTGIVLGAYWAYYVLGWGGYWAWDPVENASFMPWLTATAFLHSVMVQERRDMFRTWNLFLIITTFSLSLLGTFLVRSGVLSSVHAFANDPGRGVFILIFMAVVLLFSFGVLVFRADHLRSGTPRLDTILCKESAFLFNNMFFMVAALTVLLGTLYPLAMETLAGTKVTVGAPYFNKVFVPIMLGTLALMGMGLVIPWRRATAAALGRMFRWPLLLALLAILPVWLVGVRHPYGIIGASLVVFVLATHTQDLYRGVAARRQRDGRAWPTVLWHLVIRNQRRYGGLVTHLGVLLMVAGFIGSGLFQQERDLVMRPGDVMHMGPWQLTFASMGRAARHNWQANEAVIQADKGRESLTLLPQKRIYDGSSQPMSEAAIHSTWREDLYVVLGDQVADGAWAFRVYLNPLVMWIWWGACVIALGVGLSMLQGRRLRRKQGA
ncbi:MAG: heme lyase CcmF/NrfE family subunit [Magnetococcales bacterium]|nr:heme lyase CcmF/NrfE family subunit [Magnetococcales bacterium]MBF0321554.1 heme lyase CcmF/NrfE family subunit [Magnetococcales bacterium]